MVLNVRQPHAVQLVVAQVVVVVEEVGSHLDFELEMQQVVVVVAVDYHYSRLPACSGRFVRGLMERFYLLFLTYSGSL